MVGLLHWALLFHFAFDVILKGLILGSNDSHHCHHREDITFFVGSEVNISAAEGFYRKDGLVCFDFHYFLPGFHLVTILDEPADEGDFFYGLSQFRDE